MEATRQQALALVNGDESKTVYYALSFGEYGDWTSGEGTFADDMINMLGATNVGAELGQGWLSISLEKLLEADPDVILIPGDETMVESFKSDASYAELSAVKNGAVYAVDMNMSSGRVRGWRRRCWSLRRYSTPIRARLTAPMRRPTRLAQRLLRPRRRRRERLAGLSRLIQWGGRVASPFSCGGSDIELGLSNLGMAWRRAHGAVPAGPNWRI